MSMLVTVTLNTVYVLTVTAKPMLDKPTLKCPECGGELTCLGFVPSTNTHRSKKEGAVRSNPSKSRTALGLLEHEIKFWLTS